MSEDLKVEATIAQSSNRNGEGGNARSGQSQASTGLRPIDRFNSDERIARIVPDTDAGAVASYCSRFARDFLDANLYFCSAKFTVARGGKVKALDQAFRDAEAWFEVALADFSERKQFEFPLAYLDVPVKVTHQLAGRLLRTVRLYDRLFAATTFCTAAGSVTGEERENVLINAAKQLSQIHLLCIPDNDRFDRDGNRTQSANESKE
ncbi:hypothetical protein [Cupriavidus numazuensis]|uniref:DUF1845 domain-containing protein n=1 Tax=Cupriavidus numazuensis TaxID=221992 RepID=A0ABM8TTI6_9BURK|nr:hypothetical protein [Cupriavidus numazuensis]CAG2159764.1 hypothetical protein LMG26411_06960 [Cupriavidus numazuensis]